MQIVGGLELTKPTKLNLKSLTYMYTRECTSTIILSEAAKGVVAEQSTRAGSTYPFERHVAQNSNFSVVGSVASLESGGSY